MVSSLLSDALTDPTAVLVGIFQDSSDLDQFPSNVATHFQHIFSTEDALKEVAYFLLSFRIRNPHPEYLDSISPCSQSTTSSQG
jgi:hypothetical protein